MDGWVDGWVGGCVCAGGRTDGWTDGWMEKLYLPTLTLSTEADFHRGRVKKITTVI